MSEIFTTEIVSNGHPDKVADAISDGILDALMDIASSLGISGNAIRTEIETIVSGSLVVLSGEIRAPKHVLSELDLDDVIVRVWRRVCYRAVGAPKVVNHLRLKADEPVERAELEGFAFGSDGIMRGFAYRHSEHMMPPDYQLARDLMEQLGKMRLSPGMPYLRSDAKSQVSVDQSGTVCSVTLYTQHSDEVDIHFLRDQIFKYVVRPVFGDVSADIVKINQNGALLASTSNTGCGITGRRIISDQYGPRSPGASNPLSGRDPSKADRSAAYMARHIAKNALVEFVEARSASIQLVYGGGQVQPYMVVATLDDGTDITDWLHSTFTDLSPFAIQQRFGLWKRDGWTYGDTARRGHFGQDMFPWELTSLAA